MSASVVPARAGMSPVGKGQAGKLRSGPRASGDEPVFRYIFATFSVWSPRERG